MVENLHSDTDKLIGLSAFVICQVWADPFLRKRLIVGIMLMVFQQAIAINTVSAVGCYSLSLRI